jgi:hypothetical protein
MIEKDKLPNEFKIGLLILDLEHPATFSDIIIMLVGQMTLHEANIAMDRLDDIGLTKENFVKRGENWIRQVTLSSEGRELFETTKNYIKTCEEFYKPRR